MVKGVTYDKPSSTQWINESYDKTDDGIPDLVPISTDTGNAIYKDEQQGNVKLDQGQKTILARFVDKDTLEYTIEENKNAGANQIDTKGEDGEDLSEKNEDGGAKGGAAAAAVGGVAGLGALAVVLDSLKWLCELPDVWTCAVAAGSIAGVAGTAFAFSFENTFDPNLGERINQTSESEDNISTIDGYSDEMSANMDSMNEDYKTYQDMAKEELTNQTNTRGDIAALQIEIETLKSQGLDASAKQAELDKLLEKSEEPSEEAEEMNALKEYIEYYASRNAEAQGVKSSGDTVAEFLQDGGQMKDLARFGQISAYIGAAAALVAAVIAYTKIKVPMFDWAPASVAAAFMVVTAGLMGATAVNMGKRADEEGAAEDAGDSMASSLSTLNDGIESQSGVTEETTAAYGGIDEEATTRLGEVQEGLDESVSNTKDGLNNQKTTDGEE